MAGRVRALVDKLVRKAGAARVAVGTLLGKQVRKRGAAERRLLDKSLLLLIIEER